MYRAAVDLVGLALSDRPHLVQLNEALALLLQSWNSTYYRFRPETLGSLKTELAGLIETHQVWIENIHGREIDSYENRTDGPQVAAAFAAFESVLGPVGAAKALHLLAPAFLPLWDRKIAAEYGCRLRPGDNSDRYLKFVLIAQAQANQITAQGASSGNILKALDEYNYCRFARGWIAE
jgi:hypothetical protein